MSLVEPIPAICTVRDVCHHLRMSKRAFYEHKAELEGCGVLVEIVPRLDRKPRYRGQAIADFISAKRQTALVSEALRELR